MILLFVVSFSQALFAQKGDDPVLFSIDNTPVHLSEFKYIYTKTNGDKADFSKASLKEYLDLYTNFKLKVRKAKDMQLDTITSLQQELAGYRRQLADSYLIDREVTEKLVEEVYERTKQDVDLSHIMFKFPDNPSPEDTLKMWNKALEAKKKLENGESFDDVAVAFSDDQSVSKNKGHIGYVTALFPNGFYALETAAYEGPIGKVQGPVRTTAGYHLLVIHDRRPARGEVEVAHILVRNDKYPNMILVRERVDSIYAQLKAGAEFEELARIQSDDKITSSKGGYIAYFGINLFEKAFEDAAFSLAKDGDYTGPVQTSIGWHIIKRISLKRDEPFPMVKSRLQNQVKEDYRFQLAREKMIERIKKESNFTENRTTLKNFVATLMKDTTESFLTYKWKAPENPGTEQLFAFGKDMKITLGDFEAYLERASRQRQQMARQGITTVATGLYEDFVDETALKYEERQLEVKYPEFKSLMREYEEGVLLFEVTKMEVWDKASLDTVGLQKFFDENKSKYHWEPRAVVSQYSLVDSAKDQLNQIREYAAKNPPQKVLEKFNPGPEVILTMQERKYERGRNELLDRMEWKVGELSVVEISKRDRSASFLKIEELLPASPKSLQEARGYVVADYQDFLEKKWLEDLMKTYKIKVNEKVFNSLVKKS
jgi:peptidyl-prolyl cis-trans isomerase SurA